MTEQQQQEIGRVKVIVRLRPNLKGDNSGPSCITIPDSLTIQLQNMKVKGSEVYEFKYKFILLRITI